MTMQDIVKTPTQIIQERYRNSHRDLLRSKARDYSKRPEVRVSNRIASAKWFSKPENKQKVKQYKLLNPELQLNATRNYLQKMSIKTGFAINEFRCLLIWWSKSVRKRDDNRCQVCGQPAIHAHHIFEKSKYPQMALILNNGISLCEQHHNEVHWRGLIFP